jgi:hypothetical protein
VDLCHTDVQSPPLTTQKLKKERKQRVSNTEQRRSSRLEHKRQESMIESELRRHTYDSDDDDDDSDLEIEFEYPARKRWQRDLNQLFPAESSAVDSLVDAEQSEPLQGPAGNHPGPSGDHQGSTGNHQGSAGNQPGPSGDHQAPTGTQQQITLLLSPPSSTAMPCGVRQPAGMLMVPLYSSVESTDGGTGQVTLTPGESPIVVVQPQDLQGLIQQQLTWPAVPKTSEGGESSGLLQLPSSQNQNAIQTKDSF